MSRKSRVLVVGTVTAVVVLGVSIVGAVSTFEDIALWGANGGHHVNTPARARVVDLQIAIQSDPGVCGTFSDNATTPVFEGTFNQGIGASKVVCLRNTGGTADKPLDVTASFTNVTDVDVDCTGQEADFDTTCGNNLAGEASPLILPYFGEVDCNTGALVPGGSFTNFGPFSGPLIDLPVISNGSFGTTRCFNFNVGHPTGSDELLEQAGQSDTVSFTIAFKAQYTTGA